MLASEQELKCFGKKEPKLEVDFVMKITKHQTWGRQLVIYQNVHSFSGWAATILYKWPTTEASKVAHLK